MDNQRDFKGIWIPAEIYVDRTICWSAKIIFVEIHSFTSRNMDCFFSNKYLAEFVGISETQVSKHISLLIERGLVQQTRFDGRKRYLQSSLELNFKADLNQSLSSPQTKLQGSTKENANHNNTITNTLTNSNEGILPPPIGGGDLPEKKLDKTTVVLSEVEGKEFLEVFKLVQTFDGVKKMAKQLTVDEFKKLKQAGYELQQIIDCLSAMENSKSLKSKTSCYLTLLNYLKIENGTPEQLQHYEKFVLRYTEFIKTITGGEISAPRIDRYEKRAMYAIMEYLLKNSKEPTYDGAYTSWERILNSWRMLDSYHQSRTKLTNINDDLLKIITSIKNAANKRTNQAGASPAEATGNRKNFD